MIPPGLSITGSGGGLYGGSRLRSTRLHGQQRARFWRYNTANAVLKQRLLKSKRNDFIQQLAPTLDDLAVHVTSSSASSTSKTTEATSDRVTARDIVQAEQHSLSQFETAYDLITNGAVGNLPPQKSSNNVHFFFENWNSLCLFTRKWKTC